MPGTPAIPLTAIAGGINRLRTKGGADKNSLYDLLNGWVTQAGTVKVRPGTFRNANIAQYSGAGVTKGLVAYQGQFHIFAPSVVPVPPGYELHVITHPAATQIASTSETGNIPLSLSSGFNSSAGLLVSGSNESVDGGMAISPPGGHTVGSVTPSSVGGATVEALYTHSVGGVNTVVLALAGGLAQNFFTDIQFTDRVSGAPITLTSAAATWDTSTYPGYTVWRWTGGGRLGGASGVMVMDGVTTTVATNTIIPLKEIHFAAPYLGGLYVVAEFSPDSAIAAQYGSVFHYWVQSSAVGDNTNAWEANTDYVSGNIVIPTNANGLTYVATRRNSPAPVWSANTAEVVGNVVEPTVANGFQYAVTAVEGASPTTGASEPLWPTSDGAIVNENSALANDQTFELAEAAAASNTTSSTPPRYAGIAGGS